MLLKLSRFQKKKNKNPKKQKCCLGDAKVAELPTLSASRRNRQAVRLFCGACFFYTFVFKKLKKKKMPFNARTELTLVTTEDFFLISDTLF